MGTLGGHLLPGTFFILFAIWWSFITSYRYVILRLKNNLGKKSKLTYHTTITMPCVCLPCASLRRFPVESYVKFLFAFIGLAGEVITGYKYEERVYTYGTKAPQLAHDHHVHNHTQHNSTTVSMEMAYSTKIVKHWYLIDTNRQHSTMYAAFMFGALIEILIYYRYEVPKFLDYAYGVLGYTVECFLFAFHLHGRDALDIHIHTLLVLAVSGCILFSCLEIWKPTQILFTYGRIAFTMLQGTWFWQVGFVLYPPTDDPEYYWDPNDHASIMTITMVFCWHLMLIMACLLIQALIMVQIYKKTRCLDKYLDELISIDSDYKCYITKDINGNELKFLSLNSEDSQDDDDENNVELYNRKAFDNNKNTKFNSPSNSTSSSGNYTGSLNNENIV